MRMMGNVCCIRHTGIIAHLEGVLMVRITNAAQLGNNKDITISIRILVPSCYY